MKAVAGLALRHQDLIGRELLDRGAFNDIGKVLHRDVRRQLGLDLTPDGDLVHRTLDRVDRVHQLDHRAARRFDEDARGPGFHGGASPAPRQQADLSEEFAGPKGHGLVGLLGVDDDIDGTLDDGEETVGIVVALEDRVPGALRMDGAVAEELTQLDGGKLRQQRHVFPDGGEHLVYRDLVPDDLEFFFQQWLVRRLDIVAEDVLDHLVTLIHRRLDQGEAAEGANDMEARDVRIVVRAQLRQGRPVIA